MNIQHGEKLVLAAIKAVGTCRQHQPLARKAAMMAGRRRASPLALVFATCCCRDDKTEREMVCMAVLP